MKGARHKGNILDDSIYIKCSEMSTERESGLVVARGWGTQGRE